MKIWISGNKKIEWIIVIGDKITDSNDKNYIQRTELTGGMKIVSTPKVGEKLLVVENCKYEGKRKRPLTGVVKFIEK